MAMASQMDPQSDWVTTPTMADSITFFETVDKNSCEGGRTLWTKNHDFDLPNSHSIQGVLKLENDSWKICVTLASNLEEAELVWPAHIKWKLYVMKGRGNKLLGTQDGVTWTKDDVGKCDWKHCIKVCHCDLLKDGIIDDDDGSVTFTWLAQLTLKSFDDSSSGRESVQSSSGRNCIVKGTDGDVKDVSATNCDVSLLLVGKTGNGKSATGNNILNLNENSFHVASTDKSVTETCQFEYSRYQGRTIKVVDMPGLSDSSKGKEEDIKAIEKEATTAVYETPDGYDAVLVVVRFGRQSREDKETIDSLKRIFGETFFSEYGILVVTYGDEYKSEAGKTKTFDKFCSEQTGPLNELWKECNKRVVLFDNATQKEEEKTAQRKQLFDLVDGMRGKSRYTPDVVKAATAKRDELIAKSEDLVLTDRIKSTLRLMMHNLKSVKLKTSGDSIPQLEKIKRRAHELIAKTKIEDKKVKKMKAVLAIAESINKATEGKMELTYLMMAMSTASSEESVQKAKAELESKKKDVEKNEAELEKQFVKLLQEDTSTKIVIAGAVLLTLGFIVPILSRAAGGFAAGGAAGAFGRAALPYVARGLPALPFSSLTGFQLLKKAISRN